ncbi:MAG TPA: C69 family dipeptidase, partial [Planctomycetota bacterium]|nr:C69 family dipeptidase [Planctomycetota bacterium]
TYSADAPFLPKLLLVPGGTHEPGAMVDVAGWEDDDVRGRIPQAERTYKVVGLMNEHQLALGETTTGGRRELRNPDGLLDYDALMLLTLQRARTAREAIETIDALCREYGYGSSGETFAIADKDEVWVMELIGRGPGRKGILFVAARVPDGCITASANMARITTFPKDDPENWRYSADVVQFARERGWYDPARDGEFSWRHAYHPDPTPVSRRACGTRVWSIYRRAAPSREWPADWHRGIEGAEDYPLFIKPDRKLGVRDVMALMRDHYEGTPYDMTKGIDAGPFGSPVRFRDLTFRVGDATYCWERPIATQQAGFVMVAQCRNWLPDAVGGIYWFTPDDPYTSCFLPLYSGIDALPAAYTRGTYDEYTDDSAWWAFNFVSNLTYDRWSRVLPDVLAAQREHEEWFVQRQAAIDQAATALAGDPAALARYLTEVAVATGDKLFADWSALGRRIVAKHVDGYVKQDNGRARGVGYGEEWLRRVVAERGDALVVPPERPDR